MTPAFRKTRSAGAVLLVMIAACVWVAAQSGAGVTHVHSTPENVVFGAFPIDRKPVARVRSGEVVRIDTLSHRGTSQQEDPVTFLGARGVKPEEVLQDVRDVWVRGRRLVAGGEVVSVDVPTVAASRAVCSFDA